MLSENAEKPGFTVENIKGRHVPQRIRPLWNLRRKLIKRSLGIRKLMVRLGFLNPYPPRNLPDRLKKQTFLEALRRKGYRVHAIEVPGYNEETNENTEVYTKSTYLQIHCAKKYFANKLLSEASNRLEVASALLVNEEYNLIFY